MSPDLGVPSLWPPNSLSKYGVSPGDQRQQRGTGGRRPRKPRVVCEPNQIVHSWLFLHDGLGEARRKAWGGRLDDSRTTDHVAFLATTRLNEMGAARCLCKIIFNFVVVAGQVRFLAFMVKEAEYHVALFWTVINLLCKRLPK